MIKRTYLYRKVGDEAGNVCWVDGQMRNPNNTYRKCYFHDAIISGKYADALKVGSRVVITIEEPEDD